MTYKEKLLSPKWQKLRLEIMQRDNFACVKCGNTEETLQIHHKNYVFGKNPWDYPPEMLETLCSICHNSEFTFNKKLKERIATILDKGYSSYDIFYLLGGLLEPCDIATNHRIYYGRFALSNSNALSMVWDYENEINPCPF